MKPIDSSEKNPPNPEMQAHHTADEVRQLVRGRYAQAAQASGCCGPSATSSCCGGKSAAPEEMARIMGYDETALRGAIGDANLGLGCGNPTALGKLKAGETVLDLGSGGGIDCFLAARMVGPTGRVIGVDMTPEMLAKARANAVKMDAANVSFRLGEIEHLPVADNSVDVILSNCVINLSPEKAQVFREAFRVLKPGGRLAISDVVATREMPEEMRSQAALLTGCIAGAETIDRLKASMTAAGFEKIGIQVKSYSDQLVSQWAPDGGAEQYVASADIEAVKPE
ncbi:MAG: arsenite methyltransferase [Desulfosarcinaceae bacterium]|nr:arsenite methyltransferase [Desulfosarcinaceae bacterium]